MKIKAHIIIALAAIVSLLFLVPIAAVGDENQEGEWKEADEWTAMEVNAIFKMNISTSGLFGLSFGSPYVLMEFMFSPENVNPTGKWIELVYDGPQDNIPKKLIYDEVNKAFWFPLTQVKLDGSRLIYPFNAYSTEFVISGNISLIEGEENTDAPQQWLLKTNISWGGKTISLKIEREPIGQWGLFFGILAVFLTIFVLSIKRFSKETFENKVSGYLVSLFAALGAVYALLAGFGAELMPIHSIIFWALVAFSILWTFLKDIQNFLVRKWGTLIGSKGS